MALSLPNHVFLLAHSSALGSGSDFIYPVPTDINPDGRVGNEFCVCCEYERIPDRIDRRGTGNITRSEQRRR